MFVSACVSHCVFLMISHNSYAILVDRFQAVCVCMVCMCMCTERLPTRQYIMYSFCYLRTLFVFHDNIDSHNILMFKNITNKNFTISL